MSAWTPERTKRAETMWREGYSANHIASAIGGGLSRNAVIGKMHRMGLTGAQPKSVRRVPAAPKAARVSVKRREGDPVIKAAEKRSAQAKALIAKLDAKQRAKAEKKPWEPKPPTMPAPREPLAKTTPKPLLDLGPRDCRFAVAEDRRHGHLFCAAEAGPGDPYCAAHMRIAYQSHDARIYAETCPPPGGCPEHVWRAACTSYARNGRASKAAEILTLGGFPTSPIAFGQRVAQHGKRQAARQAA